MTTSQITFIYRDRTERLGNTPGRLQYTDGTNRNVSNEPRVQYHRWTLKDPERRGISRTIKDRRVTSKT